MAAINQMLLTSLDELKENFDQPNVPKVDADIKVNSFWGKQVYLRAIVCISPSLQFQIVQVLRCYLPPLWAARAQKAS